MTINFTYSVFTKDNHDDNLFQLGLLLFTRTIIGLIRPQPYTSTVYKYKCKKIKSFCVKLKSLRLDSFTASVDVTNLSLCITSHNNNNKSDGPVSKEWRLLHTVMSGAPRGAHKAQVCIKVLMGYRSPLRVTRLSPRHSCKLIMNPFQPETKTR